MEQAEQEKLADMVDSLLYADPSNGIDLCFTFDTTGSMFSCLQKVRENISTTCTKLLTDIPKIRIGALGELPSGLTC